MPEYYAVFEGTWDPDTGEEAESNFIGVRTITEFKSEADFKQQIAEVLGKDLLVYHGFSKELAHQAADQGEIGANVLYALWKARSQPHLRMQFLKNQVAVAAHTGRVLDFISVLFIEWDDEWGDFVDAAAELIDHSFMFARK